jgi:hypothetical protein
LFFAAQSHNVALQETFNQKDCKNIRRTSSAELVSCPLL